MKNCDINIRDPFVLVHDGKYYMYGTRAANFGCKTAGFDVYVGTDLENWSEPIEVFNSENNGFNREVNWAPEVHKVGDKFYMLATFTKADGLRGTHILVSDSPTGQFKPHSMNSLTPDGWECLDGTLYEENGKYYCVFCHEHTQILNGTVCYIELSDDLTHAVSESVFLFDAGSYLKREASEDCHNVTDGPFMHRLSTGELVMIWSTVSDRYLQLVARSSDGTIGGQWTHLEPLFTDNGGHGMLFEGLDGQLRLTLHCPNISYYEKPVFFPIAEKDGTLVIAE